jgi:hypothetical protein
MSMQGLAFYRPALHGDGGDGLPFADCRLLTVFIPFLLP